MPRGMPSLVALLGLLAVAGYQNRDKISDALGSLKGNGTTAGGQTGGLAGIVSEIGSMFRGGDNASSNVLSGGLGDLLNRFKTAGQGDVADSWIRPDVPTQGLTPSQVEQAIGTDNLRELAERTGLSHQELLDRLATAIPSTVDALTPGGRMPTEDEARSRLLPNLA